MRFDFFAALGDLPGDARMALSMRCRRAMPDQQGAPNEPTQLLYSGSFTYCFLDRVHNGFLRRAGCDECMTIPRFRVWTHWGNNSPLGASKMDSWRYRQNLLICRQRVWTHLSDTAGFWV